MGVLAVMIVAFGGLRHAVMAMAALVMGMVWACGCIALTVGYVNILSIAFGSILFGLGIDYGIYYVARYLQIRDETDSTSEALVETAGSVGPGIFTGALTSAIAFFAAGLTEFSGVAQLGLIAGGGICLCWLAAVDRAAGDDSLDRPRRLGASPARSARFAILAASACSPIRG